MTRVYVTWADDEDDEPLPESLQEVPQQVYDNGMTAAGRLDDPVSEYLSDTYGYLVSDWVLA